MSWLRNARSISRGDDGEHLLVGSCYLHGFMMGEEATPARYKPEPIMLR